MSTITLSDVLDYIASSATTEDIDRIREFTKNRSRVLRDIRAADVSVGQVVTLQDINPKAMDGMIGTVTKIESGRGKRRATVTLDEASTQRLRFARTQFSTQIPAGATEFPIEGVPLTCCVPLP